MNFEDQNEDKRIACRLAPVQNRSCMESICEAKMTEIEGQGVRHRNGACCLQKQLSATFHLETWNVLVST